MLKIIGRVEAEDHPSISLTLTFEYRQKSRQKVVLDSGEEAGLFLPRGTVLRGGDLLKLEDGRVILVISAQESVSVATSADSLSLMRACYHLGNRHVHLQIGDGFLRYQHDPVLDGMVSTLGLVVTNESASFEPEPGAYHGSRHRHDH